ncbi:MAG: helix-turn-helix transcriptional regulator [Deltaproteobacteria bacterium]|nr:helix-turn-helix transcriptional regulator [Deltaproteobacteria bacterium]
MTRRDHVLDIVSSAYDAALDPSHWNDALGRLRARFEASNVTLMVHDVKLFEGSIAMQVGMDASALDLYLREYSRKNVFFIRASRTSYAVGKVASSEEVIEDRELERTEFFADFSRPHDVYYSTGVTLAYTASVVSFLAINRSKRCGPLDAGERETLRRLAPHFSRALQIHRRVCGLEAERRSLVETLTSARTGAVLLDSKGEVVEANAEARAILDQCDGIGVNRDRRLTLWDRDAARLLLRAVGEAASTAKRRGDSTGGTVCAQRPSGRRALELVVAPLCMNREATAAENLSAVVFVTDPSRVATGVSERLIAAYGLTRAEARVAALLAEGSSPTEIAERLAVTGETVKTHLKHIFGKTGARRQSELIALINRPLTCLQEQE